MKIKVNVDINLTRKRGKYSCAYCSWCGKPVQSYAISIGRYTGLDRTNVRSLKNANHTNVWIHFHCFDEFYKVTKKVYKTNKLKIDKEMVIMRLGE